MLQRIKGKKEGDESDEGNDDEDSDDVNSDEENEGEYTGGLKNKVNDIDEEENANEEDYNSNDNNEENEDDDEENKLLINFEENKNKKEKKLPGVFGMKFMKESKDVKEKLYEVMNQLEEKEEKDEDDSDEDTNKKKPKLKSLISMAVSSDKIAVKGKYNARQKNKLEDGVEKVDNRILSKNDDNKPNKITADLIEEVNKDAKKYTREKQNLELTESEIKKIVDIEEIKNDKTSFYENFFVKNDEVSPIKLILFEL